MAQIHALTPEGRLPSKAVEHVQEIIGSASYVGPWHDIADLFDPSTATASGVRVRRSADRIEYTFVSLTPNEAGAVVLAWGSLPSGYRPTWAQYGSLQTSDGEVCDITANTGGGLVINGATPGETYRGNIVVYTTAAPPTSHPGDPA